MKNRIVGQLVTADGQNLKTYWSNDPADFWNPVRKKPWVIPATEVRSVQGPEIPLRLDHGLAPVGQITHLERVRNGSIWAVGELDEDLRPESDTDTYLSVEALYSPVDTRGVFGNDIEIRGASLCAKSCMIGLAPLTWVFPNGLTPSGQALWRFPFQQQLLENADTARRQRGYGDPILVRSAQPVAHATSWPATSRPSGRIEYRSAQTVDVDERHRLIEVLAVPYGVDALVPVEGRMIAESFSNVAFAKIHEQRGRIIATRDHDQARLIGLVTDLEPFHPEGLVATIRASNTELGRESVELARDQVLDCSIGFQVPKGGEQWEGRNRRRITKAILREISLVADPAYPTKVLAVRGPELALT